jgi:toxin-antitoxin system PIN domain toxin
VILPDVNVLIYAFRNDAKSHHIARAVLDPLFAGDTRFGISPLTLGTLVRVTTNARTFANASSLEEAFGFCDDIYSHGNCQIVAPGDRHWRIFERLCRETNTRGPDVADVWYAALAIEWGCEWITFDRDYARFPDLNCRILTPQA